MRRGAATGRAAPTFLPWPAFFHKFTAHPWRRCWRQHGAAFAAANSLHSSRLAWPGAQPGASRVVRRSHACSGPQATSKGRRLHGAAAPRPAAARAHPSQLAAAAERPPAMRESSSSEGEDAPQPSATSGQPDAEAVPAAAGKRPQQREPLALPDPSLGNDGHAVPCLLSPPSANVSCLTAGSRPPFLCRLGRWQQLR